MNRLQYASMYRRLAGTNTKYAECIRITRRDGVQFRFTAHDKPLIITEDDDKAYTYESANSFELTAIETQIGLVISNMDINGIIDSDAITTADLRAGMFDHAQVDLFLAYWSSLRVQMLPLRASWIGELTVRDQEFKVDLRGIAGRLAQVFVQTTSLECRWKFAAPEDGLCGLNAADYTVTGSVGEEIIDNGLFFVSGLSGIPNNFSADDLAYGELTWTSGANEGTSMEVLNSFNNRLRLFLPMPFAIAEGDTFTAVLGCDKRFSTCCNRFNNGARFGGEPWLAGSDRLTAYPNSFSAAPDEDEDGDGGNITVIDVPPPNPDGSDGIPGTPDDQLSFSPTDLLGADTSFSTGAMEWSVNAGTFSVIDRTATSPWDAPAGATGGKEGDGTYVATLQTGANLAAGNISKSGIMLSKIDYSNIPANMPVTLVFRILKHGSSFPNDRVTMQIVQNYDDSSQETFEKELSPNSAGYYELGMIIPDVGTKVRQTTSTTTVTAFFARDVNNTGDITVALTNAYIAAYSGPAGENEGIS